jgi:uncharacterized SAM-binding protein YcdF (DUF218 family)
MTRGRKAGFAAVALLVVAVAAYALHAPMLRAAGRFLIVSETPEPSDAIVVLGGDVATRALEAVRLYKAGIAPRLLLTTEWTPPAVAQVRRDGIDLNESWENQQKVLVGYGVPPGRILRVEHPVGDTFEELEQVRDFALRQGWRSVTIVTSNYHTRRTRQTARALFGQRIAVRVVASGVDYFDPESWWTSPAGVRTFVVEFEKLIAYNLRLRL